MAFHTLSILSRRQICLASMLLSATIGSPAAADWQQVVPGIETNQVTVAGPNRVFVARMDRDDASVMIDTAISRRYLRAGSEVVPAMAERHDGALGAWRSDKVLVYDVAVAVNGSFFDMGTGFPTGGQIVSGWYANPYDNYGGSGLLWTPQRVSIGGCVLHRRQKQLITVPDGEEVPFDGINRPRGNNEVILYSLHQSERTGTADGGLEILVKLERPFGILPAPAGISGQVMAVRDGGGDTSMIDGYLVVSAGGQAATGPLSEVEVGDTLLFSQEITDLGTDCAANSGLDWSSTFAAIGGSFHFLRDGQVVNFTDAGANSRHPRTAVAFNDDYLYFIVVDGRSAISVGMTMSELASFCLDVLGATDGVNQDGGGSSTMWIDGQVVNNPSDGSLRPVANALLMIRSAPAGRSRELASGEEIEAGETVTLYAGLGRDFPVIGEVAQGTRGLVVAQPRNGATLGADSWWHVQFGEQLGYAVESGLIGLAVDDPPDAGATSPDAGRSTGGGGNEDAGIESRSLVGGCSVGSAGSDPGSAVLGLVVLFALAVARRRAGWCATPTARRSRIRRR